MKTELEAEDIEAIADRVVQKIMSMISSDAKQENDVLFDVPSLAKYLHVSHKWIYERTQFKEIPHQKIKGVLRFRKKDIDKWLVSHNVPGINATEKILKAIK